MLSRSRYPLWKACLLFALVACQSEDGSADGDGIVEGTFVVQSHDDLPVEVDATMRFVATAELVRQSPPDGSSFARNALRAGLIDAAARVARTDILADPVVLELAAQDYAAQVLEDRVTSSEISVIAARAVGVADVDSSVIDGERDAGAIGPSGDPPCNAGPPAIMTSLVAGLGAFDVDQNGGVLKFDDSSTFVLPACGVSEQVTVAIVSNGSYSSVSLEGSAHCYVVETRPMQAVNVQTTATFTWHDIQEPELYEAWRHEPFDDWRRFTPTIDGNDISVQVPFAATLTFCLAP